MTHSSKTGTESSRRYTEEEAKEILVECDFLELSMEALREKAKRDLEYHQRPKLRAVSSKDGE